MQILDFLMKLQDEYLADLIEYKDNLDTINIKIKENTKFVELLESENEQPFSEFTPRRLEYKNKNEIDNINNIITGLENEKSQIEKSINELENKLSELKEVVVSSNSIINNKSIISNNTDMDNNVDILSLKEDIKLIASYLPADPLRAKIELENIQKKL